MAEIEFVTMSTLTGKNEVRRVTIMCNPKYGDFVMLGNLGHNTILLIDQPFIDDLQKALNNNKRGG